MSGSCLCATFKLEENQQLRESGSRLLLTKVRRDVFPEPLGPIKRMDDNVVRPLLRKTNEWTKMGIVMASKIAIAKAQGDGLRRACTKSCMAAIMSELQRFSWPEP